MREEERRTTEKRRETEERERRTQGRVGRVFPSEFGG